MEEAMRDAVLLTKEEEAALFADSTPKSESAPKTSVRVSLTLDINDLDFFKSYALQHHSRYQTVMKRVLNQYAQKYSHA
jgi:hypothetical protein